MASSRSASQTAAGIPAVLRENRDVRSGLRHRFTFSPRALELLQSANYITGDDIVLHIKVSLEFSCVIVNDCFRGVWGRELRIPLSPDLATGRAVDLEVAFHDTSVRLSLPGDERGSFDRWLSPSGPVFVEKSRHITLDVVEAADGPAPPPSVPASDAVPPPPPAAAVAPPAPTAPALDDVQEAGTGVPLVVIGNGPSLRGFDLTTLTGCHTIGMNAAYRHWERIGWWPTYYCCLDHELIRSHADFIAEAAAGGRFRRMFLAATILDLKPELKDDPNIDFLDEFIPFWWEENGRRLGLMRKEGRFFDTSFPEKLTTGSFAPRWAATLGYRRIGLIGIDCRYVALPQWKKSDASDISLVIEKSPETNPNYFFDDYQRSGDRFNIPNPPEHGGNLHLQSFSALAYDVAVERFPLAIHNLNPRSELFDRAVFPYETVEKFLDKPALKAVIMPLVPRELNRALEAMRSWDTPEKVPFLGVPSSPVSLVYCFNCAPDPALEAQIRRTFDATSIVRRQFSELVVHFCDLPPEKDLYVRKPTGIIPEFGYKSGPNFLFLETLRYARRFDGFFFQMESDCVPVSPGWAGALDDLCRRNRDAWILGALYRGIGGLSRRYARHINGNALYNAASDEFWEFVETKFWPWMIGYIQQHDPTLAYDCAWEMFIHREELDDSGHSDWRLIRNFAHRFRPCSELVNIAGNMELQGAYRWDFKAIRETFPQAVVVHGPVHESSAGGAAQINGGALGPISDGSLWPSGVCVMTSDFSARLMGDVYKDLLMAPFHSPLGKIKAGQRLRARVTGSLEEARSVYVGISRTYEGRHEGTSSLLKVAGDFTTEIEHAVLEDRLGFRVQIGLAPGQEPVNISVQRIEVEIFRADPGIEEPEVAGTIFAAKPAPEPPPPPRSDTGTPHPGAEPFLRNFHLIEKASDGPYRDVSFRAALIDGHGASRGFVLLRYQLVKEDAFLEFRPRDNPGVEVPPSYGIGTDEWGPYVRYALPSGLADVAPGIGPDMEAYQDRLKLPFRQVLAAVARSAPELQGWIEGEMGVASPAGAG